MKAIVWFWFVLAAFPAATKVLLTTPGQSATITCGANSYTSYLRWRHEDSQIFKLNWKSGLTSRGTDDIVGRAEVKSTNLEIRKVKEDDAGKFTCELDGTSHEHTLLVVSVSASPSGDLQLGSEATLQCQVKGLMPESTVQWKRPDGSPHPGSHIVQLKAVARSDAGSWNCTFSHYEVTYGVSLNIKVTEPAPTKPAGPAPVPSQNSQDVPDACTSCVTNPPTNAELLLGLSWWMWVVIGIGCLVVVLLTVFVICLCKRMRTKMRKLRKMKNDHQPLTPRQFCHCNRVTAAAKPPQGRRREKPSAPPLQPLLVE